MRRCQPHRIGVIAAVVLACATGTAAAQAPASPRISLEIEGGPVWISRNDARIPPPTGTPFSLLDLTGSGPTPYFRVAANFRIAARHHLRFVAAPVQVSGTGVFASPVAFVDRVFAAGVPTEGTYKFNTYRIGYRFVLRDDRNWHVEIGAALLTRDARIELRQGATAARDTDLGFVPLASFGVTRRLGDRAALVFDIEGLGSPQGRAIDALLRIDWSLSSRWTIGAGFRTIEGGADVDAVYTFAWLHFGVISLRYGF
jgi:hypothetical protein